MSKKLRCFLKKLHRWQKILHDRRSRRSRQIPSLVRSARRRTRPVKLHPRTSSDQRSYHAHTCVVVCNAWSQVQLDTNLGQALAQGSAANSAFWCNCICTWQSQCTCNRTCIQTCTCTCTWAIVLVLVYLYLSNCACTRDEEVGVSCGPEWRLLSKKFAWFSTSITSCWSQLRM